MDAIAIAPGMIARGVNNFPIRAAKFPSRLDVDGAGPGEMELDLETPERDLRELSPDEAFQGRSAGTPYMVSPPRGARIPEALRGYLGGPRRLLARLGDDPRRHVTHTSDDREVPAPGAPT